MTHVILSIFKGFFKYIRLITKKLLIISAFFESKKIQNLLTTIMLSYSEKNHRVEELISRN